jgi:hypothetical protein
MCSYGGPFFSTKVVVACLALAPAHAYAWGTGGGGGPPPNPCASLPFAIADADVIQIDAAPAPYRVADCPAKLQPLKPKMDPAGEQKSKQLKGKVNQSQYYGGPAQYNGAPSQQGGPQDQGAPPPPPPPQTIPTTQTIDGSASVTGTPQPYSRTIWALDPRTGQWVSLTISMNRGPDGRFPQGSFGYQGVPLVNRGGQTVGYADATVNIRGRSMSVHMTAPFNYSWGK